MTNTNPLSLLVRNVASVEKASLDFSFRLSTAWAGCHALYSLDGDTSNTTTAKDAKQASEGMLVLPRRDQFH